MYFCKIVAIVLLTSSVYAAAPTEDQFREVLQAVLKPHTPAAAYDCEKLIFYTSTPETRANPEALKAFVPKLKEQVAKSYPGYAILRSLQIPNPTFQALVQKALPLTTEISRTLSINMSKAYATLASGHVLVLLPPFKDRAAANSLIKADEFLSAEMEILLKENHKVKSVKVIDSENPKNEIFLKNEK